jgi:hypothetical protein
MFVIITDGAENASREYSAEKVKAQIKRQKEKYGWEFIFLGANIDAVETADRFGISANRAVKYCADSSGTNLNFTVINAAAAEFREKSTISDNHLEEIRRDMRNRGK